MCFPLCLFQLVGYFFPGSAPPLSSFAVGCCVFTDNIRLPLTKYQWVTNIIRKNRPCSKGFRFFSLAFIYIVLWSYMCPLDCVMSAHAAISMAKTLQPESNPRSACYLPIMPPFFLWFFSFCLLLLLMSLLLIPSSLSVILSSLSLFGLLLFTSPVCLWFLLLSSYFFSVHVSPLSLF